MYYESIMCNCIVMVLGAALSADFSFVLFFWDCVLPDGTLALDPESSWMGNLVLVYFRFPEACSLGGGVCPVYLLAG